MRQTLFCFAKSAMTVKIFFFALFSAAFVQGNSDSLFGDFDYSDFDVLQNLTDSGRRNVLETLDKVKSTSKEFDEYIKERLSCLMWECTVQQQNLNKSITEAVTKGMLKNKEFTNFKCISDVAQDTLKKFEEIKTQTSISSQNIYENSLKEITSFKATFVGYYTYLQELNKNKKEELEKAKNEGARKRILEEVVKKVKLLDSILEEIIKSSKSAKFKFMEDYINFAFNTENNLKSTRSKGADKMMKCVA